MARVLWYFYFFFGSKFSNIHCVRASASANERMRHAESANFSHQLWIIALHNCDLAVVLEKKRREGKRREVKTSWFSLDRFSSE